MLRLALAFALALVIASTAAAGPRIATSYSIGRTGGNIAPFTVSIASDGSVRVVGPVRALQQKLTTRQLATLAAVVQAQRFALLPAATRCAGTLPDISADVVTVKTGAKAKTVLVHGDCSPRFAAVYAALARAVGLRYGSG